MIIFCLLLQVMGFIIKLLVVAVIGVGSWYAWKGCCKKPIPQFDPEEYWGLKEQASKQDKSIRPFTIKFDEAVKYQNNNFLVVSIVLTTSLDENEETVYDSLAAHACLGKSKMFPMSLV